MVEVLKRQWSWEVDSKDDGGGRVMVKVRAMLVVIRVVTGVPEAMMAVGDGDSDGNVPSGDISTGSGGIMASAVHQ